MSVAASVRFKSRIKSIQKHLTFVDDKFLYQLSSTITTLRAVDNTRVSYVQISRISRAWGATR